MLRRALAFLAAAGLTLAAAAWPPIDSAPHGALDGRAWGGTVRYDPWRLAAADSLLSGLVYWWRANDAAGPLADASGNGNTGALNAGATVGGGYVTAGGSEPADFVEAPASTGCAGATAVTLSAEVYYTSAAQVGYGYFCDNSAAGRARIALQVAATTRVVSAVLRDHDTSAAGVTVTATALPANAWTRVTLRIDTVADTVTIRVGDSVTTQSVALGALGSASSAHPPGWGANAGFSQTTARGAFRLRNAAKYSRALSDDEIEDLHDGWTPP